MPVKQFKLLHWSKLEHKIIRLWECIFSNMHWFKTKP